MAALGGMGGMGGLGGLGGMGGGGMGGMGGMDPASAMQLMQNPMVMQMMTNMLAQVRRLTWSDPRAVSCIYMFALCCSRASWR
jgi:hypothetical protein